MVLQIREYSQETNKPLISISALGDDQQPMNHLFVRQDTNRRNDATTVQFQRIVRTQADASNPKALRVLTVVQSGVESAIEWAISGEVVSHATSGSNDATAVSGVADKRGTVGVFGGHFQAKDWNIFNQREDVTALVGVEINTPAVGWDHPSANGGYGMRRGLDLVARTNRQVAGWNGPNGNSGEAEIGAGLMIRNDRFTNGTYRYGAVIDDISQGNPRSISVGLQIATSGLYGARFRGAAHSRAAIGLDAGAKIELGEDGGTPVGMSYDASGRRIVFYRGGEVFAYLGLDGTVDNGEGGAGDSGTGDSGGVLGGG